MSGMIRPHAVLFDAFGTLFDVRGVDDACEALFPGHGMELGRCWREKQLRYAWLRSLMDRYVDFEQVTADALTAACRRLGLDPEVARRGALSEGYRGLPPYPEVPAALAALEQAGYRLAIVSNGTPAQLAAVVNQAGFSVHLDLLSADAVKAEPVKPSETLFGVGLV